jgi:phosphoribosylpyrophosphate synthetase
VTEPDYSVVLFPSTGGAIRAEKLAKEAGLMVKLIPVPRQLSSDCGVCLRFESKDVQAVRSLLEGAHVEYEQIAGL